MKYNLLNGNTKGIVETFGAELISLKGASGKEMIWCGDENHWKGRNPHLFPLVCSAKDGKAVIEGVEYNIPKHGFAKLSEFEVFEKTESTITLLLKDSDETKKIYPYSFELYITHEILENGFKTTYKVKNTDNKEIYFCVGGHTAFNCPMNANEQFSDYDIVFNKTETEPIYQCTPDDIGGLIHKEGIKKEYLNIDKISLNYDIFKLDAIMMSKINSNTVKLINKNTQKGVEFSFNGFNSFGIWSPTKGGAPFVCLEPWTVMPDYDDATGIFAEKPNITKLPVNSVAEFSYTAIEA